ncbi:cytochrome c biogenesis CcdA family protein [Oceanobacillus alkalisoli]|uniref:cytochrome c biogenesis CcdA family protein n=1 Tax=Oceanobacillus alkalisoli TaxID=2925113 RepID=UPI001EF0A399|nr:cytochrome c biogenesis protein CcdA [Oceanobacillus alkalisoli]MCF3942258.1 cytochrome c biogenesis protein CcdA [Oceanobacillus alkalisoli]MCG5104494.1 cytochrome c biogenesis protein CcdA [Oceanobacillus alkalisoli]
MGEVTLFLAFGAGLLSFISPCSLPLYPAFLSYITGMTVDELKNERGILRKKALIHTVLFLLGFSIIFLAIGLSTSFIGEFFLAYQDLLRQLGAIILVFFGLVLTGVFKFNFLLKDRKVQFRKRPAGYLGSVLIGLGFAAGWTPCTGPILAGVIAMGVANPGMGLLYMSFYILGFSIPFLVMTLFLDRMTFIKKYANRFMVIGGVLMIVMGIVLYLDWMTVIIELLIPVFGGFTGF